VLTKKKKEKKKKKKKQSGKPKSNVVMAREGMMKGAMVKRGNSIGG